MARTTLEPSRIGREDFDRPIISNEVEDTLRAVVEDADAAFWSVVASRFPQVTTGDFDPVVNNRRDTANLNDLRLWLTSNLRYTSAPVLLIDSHGEFTCAVDGNTAISDGFVPVSSQMVDSGSRYRMIEVDPTEAEWPIPLYRCDTCYGIYLVPADAKSTTIAGVRE